jgi:hypothetical protein
MNCILIRDIEMLVTTEVPQGATACSPMLSAAVTGFINSYVSMLRMVRMLFPLHSTLS